jgi:hypothetical protein
MDYLVGVRFEASGNLYSAMGKLSMAMLAADEATGLLKNRFVDMAAAGVGMFAALTSASVQYTNTVARLAVTLNGVKDLHKNLGAVLGPTGNAQYLSSNTLTGLVGTVQSLYGGHPPKGALRTAANIANVAEYGYGYGSHAQPVVSSLLTSGVRYAQYMGYKSPEHIERISASVARAVLGHQNIAGASNQSAYLSAANSVFGSSLIGNLGKNVSPNMIATWIAATTRQGDSGAVPAFLNLMAGKGLTNAKGLPLLMNKMFGLHLGTNQSILAASQGNYLKLDMRSKDPFVNVARSLLFGLEKGAGYTTNKFIRESALTSAQRRHIMQMAGVDFDKHGPFYGMLKTYMFSMGALSHVKGNYQQAAAAGKQRTQRNLNLITDSAGRIYTQIGAGADVSGILGWAGHTLAGMASTMSTHPSIGRHVGGAGLAAAFSGISAGVMGLFGKIMEKMGFGTLAKGAGSIGSKFLAPLAMFQALVSGASLLRAIPSIRSGENFLTHWMGKIKYVNKGLFSLMKAVSDFGWAIATFNFGKYFPKFISNMKGAFSDWHKDLTSLFKPLIGGSSIVHSQFKHGKTSGVLPFAFHGRAYTTMWSAHEAAFNKKKDMEQWDADYTNPVTHKHAVQDVHIHFHGVNPGSKAGLKDVQDGIVKALRNAVMGAGFHTATPLAAGNGS